MAKIKFEIMMDVDDNFVDEAKKLKDEIGNSTIVNIDLISGGNSK